MSPQFYVLAALGLAVLMVVHEAGHYFAARHFGMRVVKFSIGFGPTLYKHRPKGSPTTYQIAIIPFLAYVQIAGMNPYEEIDEKDPGSYANASLWARIVTIAGGPVANYFFASVLLFAGYMLGGRTVDGSSMRVSVAQDGPAMQAHMKDGDKIVEVNNTPIANWDELKGAISSHPGEPIDVLVDRDHASVHLSVTPGKKGAKGEGMIQIGPESRPVRGIAEAAMLSVTDPPKVVIGLVQGLARMITGREKVELSGPVEIVRVTAKAVQKSASDGFMLLGMLSAYLAGFNLLPFPALDGGRLLFLGFEVASRRKADAKTEAKVHAVGLLMFLTLIAWRTYAEIIPKH
jgi:regulator of sigma E protease